MRGRGREGREEGGEDWVRNGMQCRLNPTDQINHITLRKWSSPSPSLPPPFPTYMILLPLTQYQSFGKSARSRTVPTIHYDNKTTHAHLLCHSNAFANGWFMTRRIPPHSSTRKPFRQALKQVRQLETATPPYRPQPAPWV